MFVGLGTRSLLRKGVNTYGRIVSLGCGRYDHIGADCGGGFRAAMSAIARHKKGETAALATVSNFY
jgi:hypothetical protein